MLGSSYIIYCTKWVIFENKRGRISNWMEHQTCECKLDLSLSKPSCVAALLKTINNHWALAPGPGTLEIMTPKSQLLRRAMNCCQTEIKIYVSNNQVALVVKNLPANAGDLRDVGSIPGSERFPGGAHGNPLQFSCLENPMDRGAWRAMVYRTTKSGAQLKRLSTRAQLYVQLPIFYVLKTHRILLIIMFWPVIRVQHIQM